MKLRNLNNSVFKQKPKTSSSRVLNTLSKKIHNKEDHKTNSSINNSHNFHFSQNSLIQQRNFSSNQFQKRNQVHFKFSFDPKQSIQRNFAKIHNFQNKLNFLKTNNNKSITSIYSPQQKSIHTLANSFIKQSQNTLILKNKTKQQSLFSNNQILSPFQTKRFFSDDVEKPDTETLIPDSFPSQSINPPVTEILETPPIGTSYLTQDSIFYKLAGPGADILEFIHQATNTPWWATVVIATFSLRFFLLPFVYKVLENQAKMNYLQPYLIPLQERLRAATDVKEKENAARLLSALFAKNQINPFKSLKFTFFQLPFMFLMFWGLYRTALYVPEVQDQGILWFKNLAEPDLGGRLPMLTTFTVWLNFIFSFDRTLPQSQKANQIVLRRVFVFLSLATIGISRYFPMLIHLYIFSTTIFTLLQTIMLRHTSLTSYIPALKNLHRPFSEIERIVEKQKEEGFNLEEHLQEFVNRNMEDSKFWNQVWNKQPATETPKEDKELTELKQDFNRLKEELKILKKEQESQKNISEEDDDEEGIELLSNSKIQAQRNITQPKVSQDENKKNFIEENKDKNEKLQQNEAIQKPQQKYINPQKLASKRRQNKED